jgi:hypothetical protein
MNTIKVKNVHQALVEGCYQLTVNHSERDSRNGPVKAFLGPLTTTYRRPIERLLFHPERDANPFFHLIESAWMIAGRNDVAAIREFNSNIASFSDDGETFHGAYGHRWRQHFDFDQIEKVIDALNDDPTCRRQVVSMWDPDADLGRIGKDLPCNLILTFQVDAYGCVEMVVMNRSNDLVWGAYGANAVHFSVLQELVAAGVGRDLGAYHQVSANTHVYERHFDLVDAMAKKAAMPPAKRSDPYSTGEVEPLPWFPTGVNLLELEADFEKFFDRPNRFDYGHGIFDHLETIRAAWRMRKSTSYAIDLLNTNLPPKSDWRKACIEWLERRR